MILFVVVVVCVYVFFSVCVCVCMCACACMYACLYAYMQAYVFDDSVSLSVPQCINKVHTCCGTFSDCQFLCWHALRYSLFLLHFASNLSPHHSTVVGYCRLFKKTKVLIACNPELSAKLYPAIDQGVALHTLPPSVQLS